MVSRRAEGRRSDMLEKTAKKLRGGAGESLAEVLISLLISAVGVLLLATMIQSATGMIADSGKKYQSYIQSENRLEAQSGAGRSSQIEIKLDDETIKLTDGSGYSTNVLCYASASGGETIVSYRVNGDES